VDNTFLCLTSNAWAAISSISAVAAVIVSLYLHFSSVNKKIKNLVAVIQKELILNKNLLDKANLLKDSSYDGQLIPKISLMCAVLITMNFDTWDSNKQAMAEISANQYIKYSEIINLLKAIQSYSIDINEKREQSLFVCLLEDQVKISIQMIKENKLC
jgi:hypothetical protein